MERELPPAHAITELSCPICFGHESKMVGQADVIDSSGATVTILSCVACSHWWTHPMPAQRELDEWYGSSSPLVLGEGWEGEIQSTMEAQGATAPAWVSAAEKALGPNGRDVLELGPGDFALIQWFAAAGYKWRAIEIGSWAPDSEQIVSHIDLLQGTECTGVVVALDVLEHVVDPLNLLRELIAHLRKASNSRVYLSFPNASSWRATAGGSHWRMVRPYGHLHYFSRNSAMQLLDAAGLKPISMATFDLDPRDGQTITRLKHRLKQRRFAEFARLSRDACLAPTAARLNRGDQWHIVATPREY